MSEKGKMAAFVPCLVFVLCYNKFSAKPTEGAKTIVIEVVDNNGEATTYDAHTDAEYLKDAKVLGIVDHHKLGDVTTDTPLECWIQPYGCANTIVKMVADYYNVSIPASIAGAMLCAILSDTVLFKSPTCTENDKKAAADLAKIAGVSDLEALGMEMFKAKSNLDASPRDAQIRKGYQKCRKHISN